MSHDGYAAKLNVSSLDDEIKNAFVVELNGYIYDNSVLNQVFPCFLFAYTLFYVFIGIHYLFEVCKIYESNLELAEIEQHLIKYFSKPTLAKFFMPLNKEDAISSKSIRFSAFGYDQVKHGVVVVEDPLPKTGVKKRRRWINWATWRVFYVAYEKLFGKNEVDVLMKIFRRKWKLDVLDKINGSPMPYVSTSPHHYNIYRNARYNKFTKK